VLPVPLWLPNRIRPSMPESRTQRIGIWPSTLIRTEKLVFAAVLTLLSVLIAPRWVKNKVLLGKELPT
jgi:hypothetical protein